MVDTRRLARLTTHVRAGGAALILVGDEHQLPPVEAGGAFAALSRRLGTVDLTENRRQVEIWERHTLARLRIGAGGRAGIDRVMAAYENHGRLHVGPTPAEVRATMVDHWYQAHAEGRQVAMLALRRNDVRELNARARALLTADGTVAPDGLEVRAMTFAAGDRVVCHENDRRLGVHNALFGTITSVDTDHRTITLRPDGPDQDQLLVPADYLDAGHLDHAYATTIHKAQGATYDHALVLADDRLYRQAGYTALSRGRVRNDLYIVAEDDRNHDPELEPHAPAIIDDPLDTVTDALWRDGSKHLASLDTRDAYW